MTHAAHSDAGALAIEELVLVSRAPQESASFLAECLPALVRGSTSEQFASVRFAPTALSADSAAAPSGSFWKFTVFSDEIGLLRDKIVNAGVAVSEPVQFGTIGYLCHLHEPGGNEIELLQRTFKDNPRSPTERQDALGLITLRVQNAAESARFYTETLGMRALSEMSVDDGRVDPFDLSFFAFAAQAPPPSELSHVDNREWLYQRPYTIVELQHYRNRQDRLHSLGDTDIGLAAIALQHLPRPLRSPDQHRFVVAQ